MIAGLLSVNSTLTVLDIACNGIDSDYDIFTLVDGIRYLSNKWISISIESIKNIHVFLLFPFPIRFSFRLPIVDNLSIYIRRNRSKCKLKELYLEENKFGISGCRVIITKDNNNTILIMHITSDDPSFLYGDQSRIE